MNEPQLSTTKLNVPDPRKKMGKFPMIRCAWSKSGNFRAVSVMLLLMCWAQSLSAGTLFRAPVDYDAGGVLTSSLAVGDVNQDGIADVVVVNETGVVSQVGVLLGNGDGTFKTVQTFDCASGTAVTLADVNGDGKLDVLVTGTNISLGVFLGNGDGTFQPSKIYRGNPFQRGSAIAVGDLNGDGNIDVIVGGESCSSTGCKVNGVVGVFLGKGDGSFETMRLYNAGGALGGPFGQLTISLTVADVDGDGILDVVVANFGGSDAGFRGVVGVLRGRGDGTLRFVHTFDSGGYAADSIAVADVNGDGKADLIVGNYCAMQHCPLSGDGNVAVLYGKGDGTFLPAQTYDSGGYGVVAVAVADVDNDGHLDLVALNTTGHVVAQRGLVGVLLGDGTGTFLPADPYSTRGQAPTAMAFAKVNADDRPDLVVTNGNFGYVDGTVAVLLRRTQ